MLQISIIKSLQKKQKCLKRQISLFNSKCMINYVVDKNNDFYDFKFSIITSGINTYLLLKKAIMQKNKQNQAKKQIVDYNYVNNIFCTLMSTLQSLKLITQNRHEQMYVNKLFTFYDKIDFSTKNKRELQSQLQTHLIIFKASLQSYSQQYKDSWIPPPNFDNQQANSFIFETIKVFEQNGDQISTLLAKDMVEILKRSTNNLYIDSACIKGEYSQAEKLIHRNNLINYSIRAQNIMDQERDRIQEEKIGSISQLKVRLNSKFQCPIYYRYLLVPVGYYQQNLKDNVGFQLCLLEESQLYENEGEAMKKMNRKRSKKGENQLVVQLQVCNQTVMRIKVIAKPEEKSNR